jgi:hypothetical protein
MSFQETFDFAWPIMEALRHKQAGLHKLQMASLQGLADMSVLRGGI